MNWITEYIPVRTWARDSNKCDVLSHVFTWHAPEVRSNNPDKRCQCGRRTYAQEAPYPLMQAASEEGERS